MKAYDIITDRIIDALERGTVPWRKPWNARTQTPRSLSSGRPYRGINVFMLMMTAMERGYSDPRWLTFNQARKRGGKVRKGEKGTPVVLWKFLKSKDDPDKTIPFLRYFTVFNVEQCDDIAAPDWIEDAVYDHDPVDAAEEIVREFCTELNGPLMQTGGSSAYFDPARDLVNMPERETFFTAGGYYSTLFHELGHSTGHKSRLGREQSGRFGSGPYSREELVAELTACFLMSEAGLEPEFDNSAAYIKSWLEALKDDRRMVVTAATAAQKAADHILGREAPTEQPAPDLAATAAMN